LTQLAVTYIPPLTSCMMEVPRSDSFSRLPVEIILHCFCSLSSFWDALRFAATCQQNRWIWTANVSIIYQHISPKAIQCRRYARTLLADQGGAPADSHVLTTHDVLQLVRNTVVMKKSIEQFNKVYVYRFTTGPNKRLYSLSLCHQGGADQQHHQPIKPPGHISETSPAHHT